MIGRSLTLGLRLLSVRSYAECLRLVFLTLACATVTVTMLALAAVPGVIANMQQRVNARAPVFGNGSNAIGYKEKTSSIGSASLTRVVVDRHAGHAPHPPGIPRDPGVGEAYLSPALRRLTRRDPVVARYFRGYHVIGSIGVGGLGSPDELRAVQGPPTGASERLPGMNAVRGFGADAEPEWSVTGDSGATGFVMTFAILLILGPAAVLLATVARLAARQRDHKLAALHAVGIPGYCLRLAVTMETVVGALAGAVAGLAIVQVLAGRIGTMPGSGVRFQPTDIDLPYVTRIAFAALVVAFAALIGFASTGVAGASTTRGSLHVRRRRWVSCIPLAVGLAGLVLPLTGVTTNSTHRAVLFIGATVLVLLGMAMAVPVLVQRLARATADRTPDAGSMIGLRWVAADPGAGARLAIGVGVGLFVLGVFLPTGNILRGDPSVGLAGLAKAHGYNVVVRDANVSRHDLAALPGAHDVLPIGSATDRNGGQITVVYGGCGALRSLVEVTDCSGRPQWIQGIDAAVRPFVADHRPPFTSRAGQVVDAPSGPPVRALLGIGLHGALLLPGQAPRTMETRTFLVNLPNGGRAADEFTASLAAIAPTADVTNEFTDWVRQANAFAGPLRWLTLALGVGVGIAALAVCMASLGDAGDRRSRSAALSVLGAPKRARLAAHIVSQLLPACVVAVMAVLLSRLCGAVLAGIDARAATPWTPYLTMLALAVVTAVIVAAVTAPVAVRRFRRQDLK